MLRSFFTLCFWIAVSGAPFAQPTVMDADGNRVIIHDASRIVSVGGSVTEIVYALGAGSKLVGNDTSSKYPEAATELPKVGYQRRLSAEGVLSLNPALVLATTDAGPPTAIAQLRAAGVTVLILQNDHTVAGAQAKIRNIARALGLEDRGEDLVRSMENDLAEARRYISRSQSKSKVLFIYARGQGTMLVSGSDTAADAMIRLAGGVNAVTGYEGYKPLTAEAVVAAAPDLLLLLSSGLDSVGGIDGLLKTPGLALTPAGKNRRILTMNGLYLLGFGPRTGRAVRDLAFLLHPELKRGRP